MRTLQLLLIALGCLSGLCAASGQIYATNTAGVIFTNKIGQAEAANVASHLIKGMPEEDAKKFLERHGLGWSLSYGGSFGWSTSFPLTNGCSLHLDIKPKKFSPDGEWRDGRVQAAFIQSNGIQIISIILTNAPSYDGSSVKG